MHETVFACLCIANGRKVVVPTPPVHSHGISLLAKNFWKASKTSITLQKIRLIFFASIYNARSLIQNALSR